ncbi:MAG TPA: PIG-L family deacetylase [Acidimicrobiales bacterium]|nr:PIG-L family deacetylase [Acidimicrobiales bacterium]
MKRIRTDLDVPARALAVGAHPDDVEFGCGATLAKWAASGCEVHHLVCTDGSKGSWEPGEDLAALVATRQEEQRAASRALGGEGRVTFLGWTDGELEAGLEQRRQVAACIRRTRPEVVLGHDPWRRWRLHPDHRHAGFLATDGIVAARDPHFFPELGLEHWRPSALLLWEADEIDHVEDASEWVEVKLRALLEHRSQLRSTMAIDDPGNEQQVAAFRARVLGRLADHGRMAGLALGEGFKLVTGL